MNIPYIFPLSFGKSFNPCATCACSMGNENLDESSLGSSSLFLAIAGSIVGAMFDPLKNFPPIFLKSPVFIGKVSRERLFLIGNKYGLHNETERWIIHARFDLWITKVLFSVQYDRI